ncbi:MAG: SpoIIE family protein phosphatase [Streptosporangiaceae bacterium]
MADSTGFGAFDREFADFSRRITALRTAQHSSPATAEALFIELELAEEELHVIRDQMTEQSQEISRHSDAADRDRSLLRAVFSEMAVPVFVLDHGGFVRRANGAAAELLGTASAYISGKPFPIFVDLTARAAFRSQLSAVFRNGGKNSFTSVLLVSQRRLQARIMLARVDPSSEVQPLVTVAVLPPAAEPAPPAEPVPRAAPVPQAPVPQAPVPQAAPVPGAGHTFAAAARRLDLMSQVTRLLLDEQPLSEPVILHRVAWLLQAGTADWVLVDMVHEDGITRAVVAGPDNPLAPHIAGDEAEAAPLPGQVLRTGKAVVYPHIQDENALGVTATGQPVLVVLGAGSVLSVPVRAADFTAGVLTLVRAPENPAFGLSDLRVLEEIGELLALALRTERRQRRRSDTAAALQASLLPQVPTPMPGLDWAAAYRPGSHGEVGSDFYDFYKSPGGCGVVLGDVCGKGEEAAAVTAMVRHGIRLLGLWDDQPAEVLAKVNAAMLAQYETDRCVTAVAAHLSWRGDGLDVRLTSAGHPGAALVRASGVVSFAPGGGLPLGIFGDAETRTEQLVLRAGDTLVLYSDGVTERRATDGSTYGTARLADVLTRSPGRSASGIVRMIEDDLGAFSEGAKLRDDVAILVVRVAGAPD